MSIRSIIPRKALNKAFLKVKPHRSEIELFKKNLTQLLDRINDLESEEFHKNLVIDFLKKTYYDPNHYINTKGKNDLVIHNGEKATSTVAVIIETKAPTNKTEMLSQNKIDTKAFQELVLYYLRERITQNNTEIKHLIATNIYEWFIFDAIIFDRLFAQNKNFVKQFHDFENARLADTKTDFFYKQIAEPYIENHQYQIEFTHFNLKDYEKVLRNSDKKDDSKLIVLFKLLSPEHIIKLPFTNDSNSLDKKFYSELLHVIGLNEQKKGSKKVIERNKEGERNAGSLIENAIIQIESLDKISRLKNPNNFGPNYNEQLYNIALELSITWVNRILFLKLLEAQLVAYHKGDKSYEFLNIKTIKDYDGLNSLFFQVLACKQIQRNDNLRTVFVKIPYLNSSLFEPTEIEHSTLFISNLEDDYKIPIYSSTVLKDEQGKKRTGELDTLEYIFKFLDAYDFSTEGTEEIQEENKTLINASVLGLIFEKINGYKDGSFFTPGFITMYMCRETIRRAVLQKFNEAKGWSCQDLDALYDKIDDRNEANDIINSLKICDPAVGSGHFLVSALNEIIALKSDLNILQDRDGRRLKEYQIEVVNDELIITDDDEEFFEYNPNNKEHQRVQVALFHEKQTIIENCLFGVDINPNSVKICRLRLWIELLKNAYYKNSNELETLPNIDINIKCGNSLISRFEIDADLSQTLHKSNWTIDSYRLAVDSYRNAQNKEQKHEMEKLITEIKNDFQSTIETPFLKKIRKARGELDKILTEIDTRKLWGDKITKEMRTNLNKAGQKLARLEKEKEEIQNNVVFNNAFEWRFEFPEVLDNNGNFVGFDVVIGNPPYAVVEKERNTPLEPYKNICEYSKISNRYLEVEGGKQNLYRLFIKLAYDIAKHSARFSFIIPLTLVGDNSLYSTRKFIFNSFNNLQLHCFPQKDNASQRVFEDAKQSTLIILARLDKSNRINEDKYIQASTYPFKSFKDNKKDFKTKISDIHKFDSYRLSIPLVSQSELDILKKIHKAPPLREIPQIQIRRGEINQTIYRKYISSNNSFSKLIKGVEIGPYRINKILSQGEREYFNEQSFHADSKTNRQSLLRRIATQRITGVDERLRIVATIIEPIAYFADSTNSIFVNEPYSLEFILGLLNSKLFQWRFKKTSSNNNVSTTELESLPFSSVKDISIEIETYVKKILNLKDNDHRTDYIKFAKKIDQLVYKLYDLTAKEIEIIENTLA